MERLYIIKYGFYDNVSRDWARFQVIEYPGNEVERAINHAVSIHKQTMKISDLLRQTYPPNIVKRMNPQYIFSVKVKDGPIWRHSAIESMSFSTAVVKELQK